MDRHAKPVTATIAPLEVPSGFVTYPREDPKKVRELTADDVRTLAGILRKLIWIAAASLASILLGAGVFTIPVMEGYNLGLPLFYGSVQLLGVILTTVCGLRAAPILGISVPRIFLGTAVGLIPYCLILQLGLLSDQIVRALKSAKVQCGFFGPYQSSLDEALVKLTPPSAADALQ